MITSGSLISLCIVNLLSITFFSATGVGNAVIFHVAYNGCKIVDSTAHTSYCQGDLIFAVYCITIVGLLILPFQAYFLRGAIKELGLLAFYVILPQQIGVFLGQYLLFSVPATLLSRIMGSFFFVTGVQMLWQAFGATLSTPVINQQQGPGDKNGPSFRVDCISKVFIVIAVGLTSGIFSGLFATGGPPLIWFFAYANMEPLEIRGMTALIFFVEAACRMLYMSLYAKVKFDTGGSKSAMYSLFAILIVSSAVALPVGNFLAQFITKRTSRMIMVALLIYGAVLIFVEGMGPLETSLVTLYALVLVLLELLFCYAVHSRPVSNQQPPLYAANSLETLNDMDDDDNDDEMDLAAGIGGLGSYAPIPSSQTFDIDKEAIVGKFSIEYFDDDDDRLDEGDGDVAMRFLRS
jgi:uncharacterized membrane protein YfcA